MKRKKTTLADITERLSRSEMKKILAGDREAVPFGCVEHILGMDLCHVGEGCKFSDGKPGTCRSNTSGSSCFCATGTAD